MPKKKDDRKIERWITVKGNHIPIYEGESESDAVFNFVNKQIKDKQAKDDKKSKKEKVPDIPKRKSYRDIGKNFDDNSMQFYKDTGINMRIENKRIFNEDLVYDAMDTLADLQDKYHINSVPDPLANSGDRLQIIFCGQQDSWNSTKRFIDKDGKEKDCFANANYCSIALNPKYYSLTPEELGEIYDKGVDKTFYNASPIGSTYKDIVTHEVGHHLFDSWVVKQLEKTVDRKNVKFWDYYYDVQRYLTNDKNWVREKNPATALMNQLDDIWQDCIADLEKDKDVMKMLGRSSINMSITALASPEWGLRKYTAVSTYAMTNYHEMFAEMFTDYYANGENAKLLTKIVMSKFGIK